MQKWNLNKAKLHVDESIPTCLHLSKAKKKKGKRKETTSCKCKRKMNQHSYPQPSQDRPYQFGSH